MTNTELLAKIKAEIDKRYAKYREKMKTDDFTYYEGMADALELFEQFIDSFDSEPISADLEEAADFAYRIECEAAEKRYEEEYSTGEYCHEQSFKWGFQEGVDWHKEQMMQEAVEGTIDYVYDEKGDAYKAIRLDWLVGDFGDKVRVIVLPKEDEK